MDNGHDDDVARMCYRRWGYVMSEWIASVFLMVPAGARAAADAMLAHASGNAADASPSSFSVAVCGLDDPAIRYYACMTRVRASTLGALPGLALQLPGSSWHVTSHDDDDDDAARGRADVITWLERQGLQLLQLETEE